MQGKVFNKESKRWEIPNNNYRQFINKCRDLSRVSVVPIDSNELYKYDEKQTKEAVQIQKDKDNNFIVSFIYKPEIVQAIKSLDYKKYNSDNKTWTILGKDLTDLIYKLSQSGIEITLNE